MLNPPVVERVWRQDRKCSTHLCRLGQLHALGDEACFLTPSLNYGTYSVVDVKHSVTTVISYYEFV